MGSGNLNRRIDPMMNLLLTACKCFLPADLKEASLVRSGLLQMLLSCVVQRK